MNPGISIVLLGHQQLRVIFASGIGYDGAKFTFSLMGTRQSGPAVAGNSKESKDLYVSPEVIGSNEEDFLEEYGDTKRMVLSDK